MCLYPGCTSSWWNTWLNKMSCSRGLKRLDVCCVLSEFGMCLNEVSLLETHSDERTVSFSVLHRRCSCHPFFIFIYVLRQHHEINIMQSKAGFSTSLLYNSLTPLSFLQCFITLHKIKPIVHYKTNILHWDQNISHFVHMLFFNLFFLWELGFNRQILILHLWNMYYWLATSLGTPVQCNAIQCNSSAIETAFTKIIMFSFDWGSHSTTCLLFKLWFQEVFETLYWEVFLIFTYIRGTTTIKHNFLLQFWQRQQKLNSFVKL